MECIVLKDPNRLEILLRLGGHCVICHETDPNVLHVDHIMGNGYLEKIYFKEMKMDMYYTYLKDFEFEKKYLQVMCINCNYKKRIKNKETKNRITLAEINKELPEGISLLGPPLKVELILRTLQKYPIITQTVQRELRWIESLVKSNLNHPVERWPTDNSKLSLFLKTLTTLEGSSKKPIDGFELVEELHKTGKFKKLEAFAYMGRLLEDEIIYQSTPDNLHFNMRRSV